MRWLRRTALLAGALALVGYGALLLSRSTTFMLAGEIIARVETDRPLVALTFDDGPTPAHLAGVLDTLATEGVVGTFYLIGQDVAAHPDLVRQIAGAGHEIGNHSYSHPRLMLMGQARIATEIESTDTAIRTAGYDGPITFRPPYGKKLVMLPLYLSRMGRPAIMWDAEVDSDPTLTGDPTAYADALTRQVRPGSIILMHVMFDPNQTARDALPAVIADLKARGFTFVTLSDLLAER